jgi:pilus assembly protein CpaC
MKQKIKLAAFIASLFICVYAFASSFDFEDTDIFLGELRAVPADSPVRVAIDNPDIADIQKVTDTEVFIIGKSLGSTNLRIWSALGNTYSIPINVFEENLEEVTKRIQRIFDNLGFADYNLEVNKKEQKIYIYGKYPPEIVEKIETALMPFRDKLINLMSPEEKNGLVQIDIQILELTKDAQKKLGFNWMESLTFKEAPSPGATTKTAKFGDLFNLQSSWTRDIFQTKVDLLESEGKLKVLSRPKLVCINGKEAKLLVGGEVPVVSQTTNEVGQSTSVEYKEYGIILNILPLIISDNEVKTTIETEVSDVVLESAKGAAVVNGTVIPAFEKRTATTELYLKNQETIFIAGLIKNKTEEDLKKIPGLGSVPILGAFFRGRDDSSEEQELVISITPTIVKDKKEIKKLSPDQEVEFVDASVPEKLNGYVYSLKRKILKAAEYPNLAKMAGYEGIVYLKIHVLASGQLKDCIVSNSSGYGILDTAAVKTVKDLAPFMKFPHDANIEEIWLDIPIIYKLD